MKQQIIEGLKKLISNETQNIRTEFCYVDNVNEDGTYDLTPLSGDTRILGALVYESELGNTRPLIGSVVSVIFYDDTTCYIINISDYQDFTLFTNNSNLVGSFNDYSVVSKSVTIYSTEKEITKEIVDEITQRDNEGLSILSDTTILISSTEQLSIDSDDNIVLNTEKDVNTFCDNSFVSTNSFVINSSDLFTVLQNFQNVNQKITNLLQIISTLLPDPTLATLVTEIQTDNLNQSIEINKLITKL